MNHELLFTENAFQKSLITPGNNTVSKNNRSAFHTDNSSQADHEKFAEYLNANKRKDETEKSKISSNDTQKSDNQTDKNTVERFATQKTKTQEEDQLVNSTIDLANITALQNEITRLIAAQSDAENSTDGETVSTAENKITIDSNSDDDTQKIDSLLALIASFLNEESDDAGDMSQADFHEGFSDLLGKIQDAIENGDIPSLTSGLTIEQLTALDENLDAYIEGNLSKEKEELLETLAAQWVTLTPPNTKSEHKAKAEDIQVKSETGVTLKQNSGDASSKQPVTEERHYAQSRYDGRYNADARGTSSISSSDTAETATDFKTAMKTESGQQPASQINGGAAERFLQSSSVLSALPALNNTPEHAQALGLTQTGVNAQVSNPLTSVITQSQNATQAHPATQMVSATIQKAVKAGDDTNIKLRRDPPELGRVEVKMSIDKDNMAKIVLTAEKPETFMMLQKDSHILQQALSESGVDTQGDISFELASDNQDFGRDDRQQHSGNSGRGKSDSDDGSTIETTMDWQVDPDTGHIRYNILA